MKHCDNFRVESFVVLVTFAIIAGSAFLFTSYSSQDIPPITLCALRLLIGFIGLSTLSLLFARKELLSTLKIKKFYFTALIMGVFNNFIPYSLYPYSFYLGVDVGIASIFSGLTPLFALFFMPLMTPNGKQVCEPLNITGKKPKNNIST